MNRPQQPGAYGNFRQQQMQQPQQPRGGGYSASRPVQQYQGGNTTSSTRSLQLRTSSSSNVSTAPNSGTATPKGFNQPQTGVGMMIEGNWHQGFVITALTETGPAKASGIQVGDQLISIDGVATSSFITDPRRRRATTLSDVKSCILGSPSTPIKFTLRRGNQMIEKVVIRSLAMGGTGSVRSALGGNSFATTRPNSSSSVNTGGPNARSATATNQSLNQSSGPPNLRPAPPSSSSSTRSMTQTQTQRQFNQSTSSTSSLFHDQSRQTAQSQPPPQGLGLRFEGNPASEYVITFVAPGGLAAVHGIRSGDIIIGIDGHTVGGLHRDSVKDLIVGNFSNAIQFTLRRGRSLATVTVNKRPSDFPAPSPPPPQPPAAAVNVSKTESVTAPLPITYNQAAAPVREPQSSNLSSRLTQQLPQPTQKMSPISPAPIWTSPTPSEAPRRISHDEDSTQRVAVMGVPTDEPTTTDVQRALVLMFCTRRMIFVSDVWNTTRLLLRAVFPLTHDEVLAVEDCGPEGLPANFNLREELIPKLALDVRDPELPWSTPGNPLVTFDDVVSLAETSQSLDFIQANADVSPAHKVKLDPMQFVYHLRPDRMILYPKIYAELQQKFPLAFDGLSKKAPVVAPSVPPTQKSAEKPAENSAKKFAEKSAVDRMVRLEEREAELRRLEEQHRLLEQKHNQSEKKSHRQLFPSGPDDFECWQCVCVCVCVCVLFSPSPLNLNLFRILNLDIRHLGNDLSQSSSSVSTSASASPLFAVSRRENDEKRNAPVPPPLPLSAPPTVSTATQAPTPQTSLVNKSQINHVWLALSGGDDGPLIQFLGEKGNANAQNEHTETLLHAAARSGHSLAARLLLDRGALVNCVDHHLNFSPLMHAAAGGHAQIAKLLIDNHADVHTASNDSETALHAAAGAGHLNLVNLLILNKANVNARRISNKSPLHDAAIFGHASVVKALLENKADVNARQNILPGFEHFCTPLDFAEYSETSNDETRAILRAAVESTQSKIIPPVSDNGKFPPSTQVAVAPTQNQIHRRPLGAGPNGVSNPFHTPIFNQQNVPQNIRRQPPAPNAQPQRHPVTHPSPKIAGNHLPLQIQTTRNLRSAQPQSAAPRPTQSWHGPLPEQERYNSQPHTHNPLLNL